MPKHASVALTPSSTAPLTAAPNPSRAHGFDPDGIAPVATLPPRRMTTLAGSGCAPVGSASTHALAAWRRRIDWSS
jgi:hypothetical protein|eukprot:30445-Pelagococcus_subviridis.AAC.3